MMNLTYSQMKPNEQKMNFRGIALFFFWILLWLFVIFNKLLIFFEILLEIIQSYSIESLTKSAIGFLMSIKWTYLVLCVENYWLLTN